MSAPQSVAEFVQLLEKSGVVDPQDLSKYLATTSAQQGEQTPQAFARAMIERGLLTNFQSDLLLQGKWKNFILAEKYRILEPIGSGGMGRVYLCEHMAMRRRVAIKVLPKDKAASPTYMERFRREARAAAALDHPNIVQAYDISSTNNLVFIVMEYVDGTSLHELVEKFGPLAVPRACHYIAQAALGLQHAHEAGLIHRDIKPANLLLDRSGTVKILDLGLARFQHDTNDNLTAQHDRGAILGTADFLAPEQAVNSSAVDTRADIYSLGLTFYFLLTGKIPFADLPVREKLLAQQTQQPPPVNTLRPEVPAELAAVIARMIAKRPEQRYQSPIEVVRALKPWTSQPIAPPPPHEMPARTVRPRQTASQPQQTQVIHGSGARIPAVQASSVPISASPATEVIDPANPAHLRAAQLAKVAPTVAPATAGVPAVAVASQSGQLQQAAPQRPLPLRILRYTLAGLSLAVIVYLGVFVIPDQYQDLQKAIESKQKLIELAKQPTPPPNEPVKQPPPDGSKLPRQMHEIKTNAKLDRVSYSNKFNRLLTAGLEPPVAVVWDAETRQPIADFSHPAGVRFVEWHPQGLPQFVTACNDGGVRIFDVDQKKKIREWTEDKKNCLTAVYSPAGLLIAAGGEEQIVHVWKIDTGEARCHLKQHTGTINAITWLPDGKRLISSAYDGLALLWDVSTQEVQREFKHSRGVHTHALTRDGKFLATGQSDGQVNLWEVESGQLLHKDNSFKNAVWFVAFNSDGRLLAAAGADKRVLVYDARNKRLIAELKGHTDGISGLAWLPDSKKLVSVSLDRTIRVWEISR